MSDFESLFKNDVPMIDVRAPIEFEAGHFPTSINLPLMNNEERRLVGIRYKEAGQTEAIKLGHELVNESVKKDRVQGWLEFIQKNPGAKLYCFRGGLRSQISTQWIREAGTKIEMITGGYKALRRFLMETIETESQSRKFFILAGRTGSGKTKLLKESGSPFLDLEKYANHKGSSFGEWGPQPAQITFENKIAVDLIKTKSSPFTLLENESIMIGSAIVPKNLFLAMRRSPMIVLEKNMEERVNHIVQEYVYESSKTLESMVAALNRIQKKLGGLQYSIILKQMKDAYLTTDVNQREAHQIWVESLLTHYYDPFYDRSLKRNASLIAFQGDEQACIQFLRSQL